MAEGRSYVTSFLTNYSNKGISALQSQLRDLKKEMSNNKREQKELSKEINSAEREISAINKVIEKTGKTTDEQKKRLEYLTATIEANKEALEKLKVQQAQLQSQINDTNKQIYSQKKAMDKLKKAFADAKGYTKDFCKEVGAVAAAGTAATAGIFAFIKDAAQWADDMNTLSKVTGIGTDELQKFAYASNLVDVSTDTLTGSLTKLTRNMAEPSKAAAEAFDTLKIKTRDATGELRDRQEVFYEVIDALGKVGNETERDALAMDIFGKSAQELNPLIKGGAERLKELGDEAERAGLILSQETLDGLNEFNDKIDELKAKGDAIKHLAAAEMTPALDGLLEVAEELLNEIKEMAKTGELKKVAKELGVLIKNAATALKNLIGFVWRFKEVIGAAVVGMVAFKLSMSILGLINSLVVGFKSMRLAKIQDTAATKDATAAQIALNTAMKANPIVLVISLFASLIAALSAFAAMNSSAAESTEHVNDAMDNQIAKMHELEDAQKSRMDEVAKEEAQTQLLVEEYQKLADKTSRSSAEQERFAEVSEELAGKLGLTTEELMTQKVTMEQLNQATEEYFKKLETKALREHYAEIYGSMAVERQKAEEELQKAEEASSKAYSAVLEARRKYHEDFDSVKGRTEEKENAESNIEFLENYYRLLQKNVTYAKAAVNGAQAEMDKARARMEELNASLTDSADKTDKAADADKNYEKTMKEASAAIEESTKKVDALAKEQKTLQQTSSSLRSEMNSLANSVKALEKGEALSYDTLLNLIDKYPEYAAELINAKGNADLQRAALEKLFEAKKQEYILTQQAAIDNIRASNEETKTIIDNSKKQMIARSKVLAPNSKWDRDIEEFVDRQFSAEWSQIRKNEKLIDDYMAKINLVSGLKIDDFVSSSDSSVSKVTSGSTSSTKTADDALLDRQKLALAAYNRLVQGKIDALNAEADAAKKSADKQIAAIDAVMKKRQQEKEDANRQRELDRVNARLKYEHLDEFSRLELQRRRQDLMAEIGEIQWQRSMESQKTALSSYASSVSDKNKQAIAGWNAAKTQFSDRMAFLQGSQTYDQRVQNNSTTKNITIVQNGLNGDQILRKLMNELG